MSNIMRNRLRIRSEGFVHFVRLNHKSESCCHVTIAALIVGEFEGCESVLKQFVSINLHRLDLVFGNILNLPIECYWRMTTILLVERELLLCYNP